MEVNPIFLRIVSLERFLDLKDRGVVLRQSQSFGYPFDVSVHGDSRDMMPDGQEDIGGLVSDPRQSLQRRLVRGNDAAKFRFNHLRHRNQVLGFVSIQPYCSNRRFDIFLRGFRKGRRGRECREKLWGCAIDRFVGRLRGKRDGDQQFIIVSMNQFAMCLRKHRRHGFVDTRKPFCLAYSLGHESKNDFSASGCSAAGLTAIFFSLALDRFKRSESI